MALTTTISGGNVQLTGNPCRVNVSGGAAPVGSFDYKILLKLESPDGKLKRTPLIDAITPTLGTAKFDVSGYVDQPVKALFQYPPSGTVKSYATQAFNVTFTPGESYIDSDGDLQEVWGTAVTGYQFLKGGLNPRQLNIYNAASTNFYEEYLVNGRFLTPRPWGDSVHPAQPVKLWFMVVANVSASLKIKITYTGGTEETYTGAVTLNTDTLYEFNCNPATHGYTMDGATKRIAHFDVWLESGGSAISDSRRFAVDWRPCERPIYALFANSLGGIDDVYLSGRMTEKSRLEGSTVYKPMQPDDTVFDPTIFVSNRSGHNVWVINTGHKSASTMRYLRDLLVAKQAWLVYPNLGVTSYQVVPIIIRNADVELVNHKNDLYNMAIEFEEAHSSQFTFDNRVF